MSQPLRILYFGTPDFAVPTLRLLLASRHTVAAVVSQPDRPRGRGHRLMATPTKVVAEAADVPVWQPERLRADQFLEDVAALQVDLGVVAAYGRLLPQALLDLPRLGMINVHGSLLPRWRGAAPVHRAVIAGDAETGVTIMRVVAALDAGPVFSTRRRSIDVNDTSLALERDLAEIGAALLVETVDALAAGRATETPQTEEGVTYAGKLTKAEGLVTWREPAAHLHNLIRGLQPWPLVAGRLADTRVLIHRSELTREHSDRPPGSVLRASADALAVVGGDGLVLRILELQPEGRRVMQAREFSAGRRLEAGAVFQPAA